MSQDVPGEGMFMSALSSFITRTCYANSQGVNRACCSSFDMLQIIWRCSAGTTA